MKNDGVHSNRRRNVLKVAGGLTIGSLAGCASDNGGNGNGNGGNGNSNGGNGNSNGGNGGSSYPDGTIEQIIPYSTGGGFDFYSRLVSKHLGNREPPIRTTPQNVTPDIAGHNEMYRAEPDGYTFGITSVSSMSKAQVLRDEAEFDLTEMTHFPRIAGTVECITVGPHTDISNAQEYVDAMANGELKIAGESLTGGGVVDQVAVGAVGGVFSEDRVIDNWVQYDGTGESVAGIRREEVDTFSTAISSLLPYIESGEVEPILLITTEDGYPGYAPDGIDTLEDVVDNPDEVIGFLGVEFDRVFMGPPEIPEERASVLREALDSVIQSDALQSEAEEADRPILYADSEVVSDAIETSIQIAKEREDLLARLFNAEE